MGSVKIPQFRSITWDDLAKLGAGLLWGTFIGLWLGFCVLMGLHA